MLIACSISLCVAASIGCNRKGASSENDSNDQTPADFSVDAICESYASADSYRDMAVLELAYTLNGIPYAEKHPLSSELNRDSGYRLLWFKSERFYSKGLESLRILDLDTQNFDGQVLVSEKTAATDRSGSMSWWMDDPIARHFVFGEDYVVWNSKVTTAELESMLGIAPNCFRGTPPAWFTSERLIDSKAVEINGKTLVDASFRSKWGQVACRIDPDEKMILGIRFPNELLAEKITTSPQVSHLSLSIAFGDAALNSTFEIQTGRQATEKTVSRFVQIPETFPSKAIGESIPDWDLKDAQGRTLKAAAFQKAINLVVYGDPNRLMPDQLERLESLIRKTPVSLAWVLPRTVPLQSTNFKIKEFDLMYDSKAKVEQFFSVGNSHFLFVSNQNGVIQYFKGHVQNSETDWLADLPGVIQRIMKGDDVAREMHSDYAKFFAEYQSKLEKVVVEIAD